MLLSLVTLTGPGNPGGPMSPFHPCTERQLQMNIQAQCSIVKKQNARFDNKSIVNIVSFRFKMQTRLQGHCL